jgi:NADH-quinone oxidoreductase subunit M
MNSFPLITAMTLTPIIGALVVLLLPIQYSPRRVALVFCGASLAWVAWLWAHFNPNSSGLQFVETHEWIASLNAQYFVAVDGLGLVMVLLTAIVTPLALLASRQGPSKPPAYFALILLLQAGLFGTFTALNFFHWFFFWELSLVPAFFLIKLWGGPGRNAAATQFFLYTMVGSVAMLLSFLAIFWATGTFDFIKLAQLAQHGALTSALEEHLKGWPGMTRWHLSYVVFAGVFLGVAIKVPLIPFHTWLPAAYAEAPTPVTMLMTGLMSKMGVYGFLRILLPIFPDQIRRFMIPLLWLSSATIILSACAAFAQRDLKRIFAYSSINHLGYCILGIFAAAKFTGDDPLWNVEKAAAINGVILQMFNHGLTAAMLFWFIGFLEERSGGLRGLDDFGGLRSVAPVFCGLMGISIFASLGLPGLNGFIGEFLIFKGSFALATWATALSVIGLLVTAIFLLTVLQRVFNGPLNAKWVDLADLTRRDRIIVLPAIALMFLIGLYPQIMIEKINTTVIHLVEQLKF